MLLAVSFISRLFSADLLVSSWLMSQSNISCRLLYWPLITIEFSALFIGVQLAVSLAAIMDSLKLLGLYN